MSICHKVQGGLDKVTGKCGANEIEFMNTNEGLKQTALLRPARLHLANFINANIDCE